MTATQSGGGVMTRSVKDVGKTLAERLGITIIGAEGHDLTGPCVACKSSDAFRIHRDSGVAYCHSCARGWSPFDLCEDMLGDRKTAIRMMVEIGLFDPPSGNGKKDKPEDPLEAYARAKAVTVDALRAYGAHVNTKGTVCIPMYGPDGKVCSTFFADPNGKGLYAKGKPVGLFSPSRFPDGCEPEDFKEGDGFKDVVLTEGVKDAAALFDIGIVAIGLPGSSLNQKFAKAFGPPDPDRVVILPDADMAGREGACKTARVLHGVAASVKLAELPTPFRETGGDDVRDVLKREGGKADLLAAIAAARPVDANGVPVDPGPPPIPLRSLVAQHPTLRPPVIHGLLRQGETANVIAEPKAGKSWLGNGLAFCVASGRDWLDTFACTAGRVLIIDGELHPETIAHRLPMVGSAMGEDGDYLDRIDVWALRGMGASLLTLGEWLQQIDPGRYALVILDAWYRFLPPGLSENDNAAVMSLYNAIDGYTNHLKAAWVNIHHASKGDQTGKGITDVGSGAGSQSRAADTHLIIRPHEQDNVSVIQAVVRSFPPVEPLAIRWDFPTWTLDTSADPARLRRPAKRGQQDTREADQRELVATAMKLRKPVTKTHLRSMLGWGGDRFGRAFAPLEADGTLQPSEGHGEQGQKRTVWRVCEDVEV